METSDSNKNASPNGMKTVNIGLLIGIALVAMIGLSLFAFWGNTANASSYSSFATAKTSGENVHVVGSWVMEDRANYDMEQDLFTFYMKDTTDQVSLVKYYDPMPSNFKDAKRVVVEGKYEGNAFVADNILMKCPSKYNKEETFETSAQR
jgi:cytochrome c-type biogenesis protein CcmE